MTDDRNVFATLAAQNKIHTGLDKARPTLLARCAERKSALYLSVKTGIDSDYGELYRATGRIRFGKETVKRVRFSTSDNRDAVFFPKHAQWLRTLAANEEQMMTVEVPTYRYGSQVIEFDLTGAKTAIRAVQEACGLK